MSLSEAEVLKQSETAMKQWENLWRANSSKNGEVYKKNKSNLNDLMFTGVGKIGVIVALGHSFQKQIDVLKNNENDREYEIICVDKCFGFLLDNGVYPDYVVLADAQVGYEWMEGRDTSKSTLIANVNANPDWVNNWEGPVVFYVNKDNIKSEEIFSKISGCNELIPASSNVGNAAIILATTIFHYDKSILVGYDYCFAEKYYAFNEHTDKRYWMSHRLAIDHSGRIVKTSENLVFSARWMDDYIKTIKPRVFNASRETILSNAPFVDLQKQLEVSERRDLTDKEKNGICSRLIKKVLIKNKEEMQLISQKHNLVNLIAEILPEKMPWQN